VTTLTLLRPDIVVVTIELIEVLFRYSTINLYPHVLR
jgi:hypothetical protein